MNRVTAVGYKSLIAGNTGYSMHEPGNTATIRLQLRRTLVRPYRYAAIAYNHTKQR